MIKVTILGCGAWATTIANLLANKGYHSYIFCHREGIADEINHTHTRSLLPGISLSQNLIASSSLSDCLNKTEAILFCIPSIYVKTTCEKWREFYDPTIPVISLTKGILSEDTLFLSDYFTRLFPGIKLATLSGPNLALEVAQGQATASVVAANNSNTGLFFQGLLTNSHFRIYTCDDYKGVLLGGILKNGIAIAAGALEALELGINSRSALITRGLQEMIRFGKYFGAKEHTFYGLSGLGDLIATCSSPKSRNFSAGYALAKGQNSTLGSSVAEGIHTINIVYKIAQSEGIDMPIFSTLYQVINKQCSASEAITKLMTRSLKAE
jgi:glycerol-3-phosphate dehydrogenase (NAD(P)+)